MKPPCGLFANVSRFNAVQFSHIAIQKNLFVPDDDDFVVYIVKFNYGVVLYITSFPVFRQIH